MVQVVQLMLKIPADYKIENDPWIYILSSKNKKKYINW